MSDLAATRSNQLTSYSEDTNFIWMNLYIDQVRRNSATTAATYERELILFLNYLKYNLNDKQLDQVTLPDLNQYAALIQTQPSTRTGKIRSLSTQGRILTTIRSFFSFLMRLGVVKVNAAAALTMPKESNKSDLPVERVLIVEEAERILSVAKYNNANFYAVLIVLLETGIRISEFCGANWGDLFEDRYGNIGLKIHGKGNKDRIVKIKPSVWMVLRDYRKRMRLSPAIDARDRRPLIQCRLSANNVEGRYKRDNVVKLTKRLAKKAGINKDVSPHWFRHTFATLAMEGGADMEKLRKQLGHSNYEQIKRYVHNTKGLQDTAADKFSLDY